MRERGELMFHEVCQRVKDPAGHKQGAFAAHGSERHRSQQSTTQRNAMVLFRLSALRYFEMPLHLLIIF
jgi:hypothetical protein